MRHQGVRAGSLGPVGHVLVVEDDPILRSVLVRHLSHEGYAVRDAADASSCLAALRTWQYDVVLMDIELPDGDGLALAGQVRRTGSAGVIFVTQQGAEAEKVRGLDAGGDDYLAKPVQLRELSARIRALIRRQQEGGRKQGPLSLGEWTLDVARRQIRAPGGAALPLTAGEFNLMATLAEAAGRVVSREALMASVSARPMDAGERTVDALVARIRRKLAVSGDDGPTVVTVARAGYRLEAPPYRSPA